MVEESAVQTSIVPDKQGVPFLRQDRMSLGNAFRVNRNTVGLIETQGDFVVDELDREIFTFQTMAYTQHISSRFSSRWG